MLRLPSQGVPAEAPGVLACPHALVVAALTAGLGPCRLPRAHALLQECAKHFVRHAAGELAAGVARKRDAVLWLWRTHNIVSICASLFTTVRPSCPDWLALHVNAQRTRAPSSHRGGSQAYTASCANFSSTQSGPTGHSSPSLSSPPSSRQVNRRLRAEDREDPSKADPASQHAQFPPAELCSKCRCPGRDGGRASCPESAPGFFALLPARWFGGCGRRPRAGPPSREWAVLILPCIPTCSLQEGRGGGRYQG